MKSSVTRWKRFSNTDNIILRFQRSIIEIFSGAGDDEADRSSGSKSAKSRSSSVPAHKNRNTFSTPKPPSGLKKLIKRHGHFVMFMCDITVVSAHVL